MALAVPAGFGIALFLTELCPPILKRPIGVAVELLAAVPSIIFGIWGLFVLAPVLQRHVQPWLIEHAHSIPGLNKLFMGPPFASASNGGLRMAIRSRIAHMPSLDTVPPHAEGIAVMMGAERP